MSPNALLKKYNSRLCRGQTLVEYALIIAFLSVVAISVLASLGQNVRGSYTRITSALATAQASH